MGKVLSRRTFLISGGVLAGAAVTGLAVGVGYLGSLDLEGMAPMPGPDGRMMFNAFVTIDGDGTVRALVPRTEMGQGVHTGLATLLAEELEVDPAKIQVSHPVRELPCYGNYTLLLETRPEDISGPLQWFGQRIFAAIPYIGTGGSTSIQDGWTQYRVAGASAREMLISAAAAKWGVDRAECIARAGTVQHAASGKSATYGELATAAVTEKPVTDIALKSPDAFSAIGSEVPRVDIPAKVRGEPIYGIDMVPDGALYGAVEMAPTFGGRLAGFDETAARAVKGVVDVTAIGEDALGVVAGSWWSARKALEAAAPAFDAGPHAETSSASIAQALEGAIEAGAFHVRDEAGDVAAAKGEAVAARYTTPPATHLCMEPQNATALWKDDGSLELWSSSQSPIVMRWAGQRGVELAGKSAKTVTDHVTITGGGFGRRTEFDVNLQAAMLAARNPGKPVKLIWTREQDVSQGTYRSPAVIDLSAKLGADGLPAAFAAQVASGALSTDFGDRVLPTGGEPAEKDPFAVEGLVHLPYRLPNRKIEMVPVDMPFPIGFWRSNGYANNVFASEHFLDECAAKAGIDPVEYRRKLIADPRLLGVLEMLADKSGWSSPPGAGRGRGIALRKSFESYCGHVIDVAVDGKGAVKVEKVVSVVDCGIVINPGNVRAQIEGAVLWGLSASLYGRITVEGGRITETNFDSYPICTLDECPEIDVHLVKSAERPGGIGEPGVPPVAPALANAVLAATGKPQRTLPMLNEDGVLNI